MLAELRADGRFGAFLQFVQDAGLYDDLSRRREVTIFPPVNSAFGALSADCLVEIQFDIDVMRSLVRMHVGLNIGAINAQGLERVADAGGQIPVEAVTVVEVARDEGGVTLNGLRVIDEIPGGNGYAHALEGGVLLLPEGLPAECRSP